MDYMNLYKNSLYMDDLHDVLSTNLPWSKLKDKRLLISGATGLIGSFLVDVVLEKNIIDNLNCHVYALGRDEKKARSRFCRFADDSLFSFIPYDFCSPLRCDELDTVDYVLHLASNTHPLLYATDPIGTITTNIIGLYNMLDFAVEHRAYRFAFASSNEVYGENRQDVELFNEEYCGYINCNTVRAGYPESKRCGEALCQAYKQQKGLNVVIPRFTRSYGPTMNMSDTKAISQFIKKCVADEDIILKSDGSQFYSYTYVADAVSGLLWVLLAGKNGEAYNIAFEDGDTTLKDLALAIAKIKQRNVVFEVPNEVEASGYSKATKARLDGSKLRKLGWTPKYNIKEGLERTISILDCLNFVPEN